MHVDQVQDGAFAMPRVSPSYPLGPCRFADREYLSIAYRTDTEALLAEPGFLLKIITHVDGRPRICELVRSRLSDVVLKGGWTGPAALGLAPHALGPVAKLPVREVISAAHLVADLTLDLGEVVHDYLSHDAVVKDRT